MNIIQKPSPHFFPNRKGYKPEAIVIHIMAGTLVGTDAWFKNPASQVSAHYGVGKTGEVHQYVKEEHGAWHAGRVDKPTWKLIKAGVNPNYYTIGIEHEGQPGDIWTEAMIKSTAQLIKEIAQRWNIPIDRDHVIGHYNIYSVKANCPATHKSVIYELIYKALF